MKFGTVLHIGPPRHDWPLKFEILKIQDGGCIIEWSDNFRSKI